MQVSDQIIAVLDNLAQKFGVAIDWSQQNVIPYMQQISTKYITWEISTSTVWICFGTVMAIIGGILFKYSQKWHETYKDDKNYEGIGRALFMLAAISCLITALSVVTYQVFDIVKCLTFPELQILEYVKDLLSGN